MKVIFKTNIDAYNERQPFPNHFTEVPRKGDKILVRSIYETVYRNLKLPIRLEVVDVSWSEVTGDSLGTLNETVIICELWYNELDLKISKVAGGKPL